MKLTPPLKTHGGKSYLADWIISKFPPRCTNPNRPAPKDKGWLHYVEPYFGGGAVLLANNPEGISEVANDLNGELMEFWRVLQRDDAMKAFTRRLETTPFSEEEFHRAERRLRFDNLDVPSAVKFFIRCRQSMSGRMKDFAPITRNRTRSGMNEQVSAWLNAIEGLPEVHARLKRVLILNRPALDVIREQDGPRALFYLDPPYMHSTRASNGEYNKFEMSDRDHAELLLTLGGKAAINAQTMQAFMNPHKWRKAKPIAGRFLLSGYRSPMYDAVATACKWNRHDKKIDNKASGGKTKRVMTESIWTNF